MDISTAKWISELEMEDNSNLFAPKYPLDYSLDEFNFQPFSPETYTYYPKPTNESILSASYNIEASEERPAKQPKPTCSWNSSCTTENIRPATLKAPSSSSSPPSCSQIISFENPNSPPAMTSQHVNYGLEYAMNSGHVPKNEPGFHGNINLSSYLSQGCLKETNKRVGSTTRTSLHAQDHVIAERKRREKLSQRFIELSALVPGLKKTDKASILGDAIKYVKQLQERVKTLEEQTSKKTMESIIVKRSQVYTDDEMSSSDENFDSSSNQYLPEIEAKVSDKDVLIKIHCEKKNGCLVNLLGEIERLHLNILNSHVVPFGNNTLDITVVAQMDLEYAMTVKDLVKNLRAALLQLTLTDHY